MARGLLLLLIPFFLLFLATMASSLLAATIYELPPLVAGAVHYTLQKLILGHWPAPPKHNGSQILAGTSTYEACVRSFDKIYRVLPWRNKADVVFAVFLHQFVASKEKSKQWNSK